MWRPRAAVMLVLAWCCIARRATCTKFPIPDEEVESEASSETMCSMAGCRCFNHNTTQVYVAGSHQAVDIHCTCPDRHRQKMYLLSPPPVPNNTELLHISACDEVVVTPVQLDKQAGIPKKLEISNVGNITVSEHGTFWGGHIVIRNVVQINELSLGALSSASFPDRPIDAFEMHNVSINLIKDGALANVHVVYNFLLNNVTIRTIDENAIQVSVMDHSGEFKIMDSHIKTVNSGGVTVNARYVTLERCRFTYIASHGFRVIAENFALANSSVLGLAKSFAFDVQARVVGIIRNQLNYLEAAAFYGVRKNEMFLMKPGIQADWLLVFVHNRIRAADQGSLHCNWTLGRGDIIQDNVFEDCSCVTLSWLWDAINGELVDSATKMFYNVLVHNESRSLCESADCWLSLNQFVSMFNPVKLLAETRYICDKKATGADVCHYYYSVGGASSSAMQIVNVTLMLLIIVFFPLLL